MLGIVGCFAVEEKVIYDETGADEDEAIPEPSSLPGLDGFPFAGHGQISDTLLAHVENDINHQDLIPAH